MNPDVVRVPLRARDGSVRAYALLDAADEHLLAGRRWSLTAGYPSRKVRESGTQRSILLHREVLGLAAGDPREGDHINRDKLDCRRANLRAVTRAQNRQNVSGRRGTSRHRGVFFETKSGKWRAQVQVDGRVHILGSFVDEDEAGRVAAAFRAERMPYSTEAAA